MERVNVGILIFDDVEDTPFRVFTIAKTDSIVTAAGGLDVLPDYPFDDAPPIDLLVVPGGFGTRRLLEHAETFDWIRGVAKEARQTTSVCTGSLLLAKAGYIDYPRAKEAQAQ